MKNAELGAGDINAFGLDEFGQPVGLNPVYGAAVGTGLGTLGAIATRKFTKYGQHSELVGLGVGAVASGAMMAFPGTRAAGWTGLAATFLNNGLRQLEVMFLQPSLAEVAASVAAVASNAGAGIEGVVIEPTGRLGAVSIEKTQALLQGSNSGMPELVGANIGAASQRVELVGGPKLAGHAGHWGATSIG